MRVAMLALLAACNSTFDLAATDVVPDAPPPPDEDQDGVADSADNCPGTPNDQSDEDDDGIGDRCDNCPLVANSTQTAASDTDAIGDACDPHPAQPGDCLVMLDTFGNAEAFAAQWQVASTGPAPAITTGPGDVQIDPTGSAVTLFALDAEGSPYAGTYDPQLLGEYPGTTGKLYAISNVSSGSVGYACGVGWNMTSGVITAWARAAASTIYGLPISDEPVGTSALVRLTSATATAQQVICRVDYGLALAVATPIRDPAIAHPTTGAPGILVDSTPSRLLAYALYRSQGNACAPTLYR